MTKDKFYIGQKVCGKKLGFPGIGTVTAIMTAEHYAETKNTTVNELVKSFLTWGKTYPDWPTKPIIIVSFDTPRKSLTLTEAQNYNLTSEEYEAIPSLETFAYCADDIDNIEE